MKLLLKTRTQLQKTVCWRNSAYSIQGGDLPPYFFPDQPQFDTLVSIPRKRKAGEQASEIFDNKIIRGYGNEPKGLK